MNNFEQQNINIFLQIFSYFVGLFGLAILFFTMMQSAYYIVLTFRFEKIKRITNYSPAFKKSLWFTLIGSSFQLYMGHIYFFSDIQRVGGVIDIMFTISYITPWLILCFTHFKIYNNRYNLNTKKRAFKM